MNATVDQRWEAALATLTTVERVTIDDVQRVADALSLDVIELTNAVTERRDQDREAPQADTGRPDIIARLNGLLEDVSAPAGDVITDAVAEIERLRTFYDEWVNHGIDDIDRMDLDTLRRVLTLLSDRVDELIAERADDNAVTAYGLGYSAGARSTEAVQS